MGPKLTFIKNFPPTFRCQNTFDIFQLLSNDTLQQFKADKYVYCCDFLIFAQVNKTNMADNNGAFPVEVKVKVRLK